MKERVKRGRNSAGSASLSNAGPLLASTKQEKLQSPPRQTEALKPRAALSNHPTASSLNESRARIEKIENEREETRSNRVRERRTTRDGQKKSRCRRKKRLRRRRREEKKAPPFSVLWGSGGTLVNPRGKRASMTQRQALGGCAGGERGARGWGERKNRKSVFFLSVSPKKNREQKPRASLEEKTKNVSFRAPRF